MTDPRIIPPGEVLPPMEPAERPARRNGRAATDAEPKPKRSAAGRFAVLNGFVDCSLADLSRAELGTWLVLYRDTRNGTARTSAEDIGRRVGTSKRAVLGALARLRKLGLLTRVYKGGLNRGPSVYRVHPLPKEPA